MKYVASCSCGKDSTAMVMKLIEKEFPLDYVVFVDLGKEFKSIYATWNRLTEILTEHGIPFARLKTEKTFDYYFAEHEIRTRDGSKKTGYSWCGGRGRWGTTFKGQLIKKFYTEQFGDEPVCEYVGIAADELIRCSIKREHNIKVYPLILWGMTENDCLTYCYKKGFVYQESNGVQLYQILDRVSCFCCGNKNLTELKNIYQYLPEYWQQLKEMQKRTDRPFHNGQTIEEIENRWTIKTNS